MAQTSDQLKSEIEQTREQLGETADALAYKADVPTRTKDWIGEKKDAVVSTVSGVTSKAGEITPDSAEVSQSINRMKRLAERNPVGLAIGGAAVGFIAGLLAPSTRMEDERIGPMADDVKATAADAGREASSAGKMSCRRLARRPSRRRRNAVAKRVMSSPRACRKRLASLEPPGGRRAGRRPDRLKRPRRRHLLRVARARGERTRRPVPCSISGRDRRPRRVGQSMTRQPAQAARGRVAGGRNDLSPMTIRAGRTRRARQKIRKFPGPFKTERAGFEPLTSGVSGPGVA